MKTSKLRYAHFVLLFVIAALSLSPQIVGAAAQSPSSAPPQQGATPAPPAPAATPATPPTQVNGIPVDDIIKKFAAHESEFKIARNNYTYKQSVDIQESLPGDDQASGEYQMESEIVFTPEGHRYENVTYVGTEHIDYLNTYVFHVAPKKIEKNQRYFQGTVWVDDQDFAVVKSDGKAVPDIISHGQENLFPRFITYRENIEGKFWFPTYTHSDDVLHFSGGGIRQRMTIRYADYKYYGVNVTITPGKTK